MFSSLSNECRFTIDGAPPIPTSGLVYHDRSGVVSIRLYVVLSGIPSKPLRRSHQYARRPPAALHHTLSHQPGVAAQHLAQTGVGLQLLTDHEVDQPALVLQRHEQDALGGGRTLAHDHTTCHAHALPCLRLLDLPSAQNSLAAQNGVNGTPITWHFGDSPISSYSKPSVRAQRMQAGQRLTALRPGCQTRQGGSRGRPTATTACAARPTHHKRRHKSGW